MTRVDLHRYSRNEHNRCRRLRACFRGCCLCCWCCNWCKITSCADGEAREIYDCANDATVSCTADINVFSLTNCWDRSSMSQAKYAGLGLLCVWSFAASRVGWCVSVCVWFVDVWWGSLPFSDLGTCCRHCCGGVVSHHIQNQHFLTTRERKGQDGRALYLPVI